MSARNVTVREATSADAPAIGRLLHDFNTEYDDVTPGPEALARRTAQLLEGGDTVILVAGDGPDGLVVLRFREAIWAFAQECYLAELYVVPPLRGRGIGRALMEGALAPAPRRRRRSCPGRSKRRLAPARP
ncbi:MAG: N-acetyltransferase family protein, partial [Baekduiaceae bacterium]